MTAFETGWREQGHVERRVGSVGRGAAPRRQLTGAEGWPHTHKIFGAAFPRRPRRLRWKQVRASF